MNTRRVGGWTVFTWDDGAFRHARHDDPGVRLAWTRDELTETDPIAAAEYDLLTESIDTP